MRNADEVPQEFRQTTPAVFSPFQPNRVEAGGQANGSPQKRDRGEAAAYQTPQHAQHVNGASFQQSSLPVQILHHPGGSSTGIPERSSKRSRANNYQAPQKVEPSLLTAMGSLVGGSNGSGKMNASGTAPLVPIRRQLSGGALDKYIGGHGHMDTDGHDASSRPRSMSF